VSARVVGGFDVRFTVALGVALLLQAGALPHAGERGIVTQAGKRFAVTLDANATTGFRWRLARPLDTHVVRLVGSEYRAPDVHRAGAGGKEVWTFEAVAPGRTIIAFEYVRPWEKDVPPARTRVVPVTVADPS